MFVGKKEGSKKGHILFGVVFIIGLLLSVWWQHTWPEERIIVAQQELTLLVAKTPWHWQRGLGKRESLPDGIDGMLFVFPFSDRHGFVMRNMEFPLDILWIDNSIIVDIAPSVPTEPGIAEERLTVYRPRQEAQLVIELPAGWVEKHGVAIGDRIALPPRP